MSVVVPFNFYRKRQFVPPLVFVEMHNNQLTESAGFGAEQVVPVLRNCALLLERARSEGWQLAFVSPLRSAGATRKLSKACWIEGFEPRRHDMVFDRTDLSCYSSREFADAMTAAGSVFVLAGFSGEGACLSTLIDAWRNGQHAGFLEDASTTRPLPGLNAAESHRAVVAIASRYATTVTAGRWIEVAGTVRSELEPSYDNASP